MHISKIADTMIGNISNLFKFQITNLNSRKPFVLKLIWMQNIVVMHYLNAKYCRCAWFELLTNVTLVNACYITALTIFTFCFEISISFNQLSNFHLRFIVKFCSDSFVTHRLNMFVIKCVIIFFYLFWFSSIIFWF